MTSGSFPFTLVDNRIFVGLEVNGCGPFSFLLDTGSSSVTVETPLAARLGLKPLGQGSTDGAGESKVDYATVHLDAVALGKFALGPMDVPSLDNHLLSHAVGFQKFDGVLGTPIFADRVVTIDPVRSELMIQTAASFAPPKDAVAVPLDFNSDECPIVIAMINGIHGRFLIDTGDRSSLTVFGPFWRQHQLDRALGPTATAMTGFGVGGPIRGIVGRPASFTLDGIAVPPPVTRLSLQKAGVFASADYAGSIGMGLLKRFRVSFDYSRKKMWLQKDNNFDYSDRYDRSGLWLGLADGAAAHLVVMAVVEGSPAAQAGIQAGDIVTNVDNLSATPETLFHFRSLLQEPSRSRIQLHILREKKPLNIGIDLRDLIARPS